jgi:hypothetical protein
MDEESTQPLDPEEKENIQADLEDLDSMRAVFEAQGMKGVIIACPDCGSDHYYGWDLLKESLEHMLDTGEPRMHEPAFEPKEDEYIIWDYGKGYIDALSDTGLDSMAPTDLKVCAWCDAPVESFFGFCPKCGRSLAPMRLLQELSARGIPEKEARALLVKAGFEPFG